MTTQFQRLDELAEEQSTYSVIATFLDEEGGAVVPNSLTWSLFKPGGVVVNGRTQVPITPAAEVVIVLSGDDLALTWGEKRHRTLLVEGFYDSNAGSNLPIKDMVSFDIKQLTGVG